MKTAYSLFEDELALQKIRQPHWVESEKLGREINFAPAPHAGGMPLKPSALKFGGGRSIMFVKDR